MEALAFSKNEEEFNGFNHTISTYFLALTLVLWNEISSKHNMTSVNIFYTNDATQNKFL